MKRKTRMIISITTSLILFTGLFTVSGYALSGQTIEGASVFSKYTGSSWYLSQKAKTSPLTYKSNNTSVVTVTQNGDATAKKAGSAVITVTAPADSKYSKTTKYITVYVKDTQNITGVSSFEKKTGDSWSLGQSAKTSPLEYVSSNPSVVSVSANGTATAKQAGNVKITVTAPSSERYAKATKTISVTVKNPGSSKQSITGVNSLTLKQGKSGNLGQKAKTKLTYKSSNTYVVSVDGSGNIKAKHGGTAKIRVTAAKTEKYTGATKIVSVKVNPKSYKKLTIIKNLKKDDMKVFAKVKGPNKNVHIPQALAYRGGKNISVCFTNETYSRQAIRNFTGSSCKKTGSYTYLAHANGMTAKGNTLYVTDNHSSNRTKSYKFNSSTLKKSGTYSVEKKTGGIAYDRVNGHIYRSIGYSLKDSTAGKKFHKKPSPKWPQDIGGRNGYIYNCVSVNKNGNNRIDIYSKTGGYYGSYAFRLTHSELESVAVDDTGHLLILINYRIYKNSKTIDRVYRTKDTLAF